MSSQKEMIDRHEARSKELREKHEADLDLWKNETQQNIINGTEQFMRNTAHSIMAQRQQMADKYSANIELTTTDKLELTQLAWRTTIDLPSWETIRKGIQT